MKTTKLRIGALFLAIAIALTPALLTNCAKGDTGPAGANGTNGTNGTNGNANVKSGTFQNVTWTYNNATDHFETVISYSAITQEIVTSGAVLVYIDINGNYVQLPYSYMYDPVTIVFWEAESFTGGIRVKFHNSDLDNTIVPQSTAKFKIVAMTASGKAAHPDVDTKNYVEVKTAYGIKD